MGCITKAVAPELCKKHGAHSKCLVGSSAPTRRTKAGFRGSAQHRVLQDCAFASSTVRKGPAQCLGAPPTHGIGKGCATSVLTTWPALLKAAAATLGHAGFARGTTGRRRSAQLQSAVQQLLLLVGSARNTVPAKGTCSTHFGGSKKACKAEGCSMAT